MTSPNVAPRLAALLASVLHSEPGEPFDMDADLIEAGLDSMGAVDLLLGLEQEFSVVFPDELISADSFASGHTLLGVLHSLGAV